MVNVGTVDRVLRFLIGALLLILVFAPQAGGLSETWGVWKQAAALVDAWGAWKYVVALVGAVLLATAVFGMCPLYSLLGIRTRRTA